MLSKDGLSKISHWFMIFLVSSGKVAFLYHENMVIFLDGKGKIIFLKKIHGNMMFSVYSVKMVFLFPTIMKLRFCQKSKDDFLLKNTLNDGISGITEKDDVYPR